MKILVGVDESPFSQAALDWVKQIPWPSGTSIRVVSASPPVFVGTGEANAPAVVAQLIQDQNRMHAEIAGRAARSLEASGRTVEPVMISGDPRSTLVEEARKIGADLVVVGSHGRSGLSRLVLGSVASYVSSHAPCSVLIVKRPHDAR
ncbi:MAG TPA: universal stress protein [Candidatus Eisenbacteria bacterium]|nr:universal stress protein [Candidatus Eisenbacteria bacterium]